MNVDEWVEHVMDGMTEERLSEVFDLVAPVGNWKLPIDATVADEAASAREITNAVIFYTGGSPEVRLVDGAWHVTAPGYYVSCGA